MSELKTLARKTNSLLTQYVEVHDRLHTTPVRYSIPIPGLFKAIPFADYADELNSVSKELEQISIKASENLAEDSAFANVLIEYSEALHDSVEKLYNICFKLEQKANGKKYGFFSHQSDHADYKKSIARYIKIGEKLNSEFNRISGRFN